MRSMFEMGFNRSVFWMGNGGGRVGPAGLHRLGQATTNVNLDVLLKDISLAEDKQTTVGQWLTNRPQYEQILGADLPAFRTAWNNAQSYLGFETELSQRLSSPDPAAWSMTSSELQQLYAWRDAVNQAYSITTRHPELTPGGTGIPGAGVPARPGAKPAAPAAAPAPVGGISPLVVGVGAAAAVGLIAVALS